MHKKVYIATKKQKKDDISGFCEQLLVRIKEKKRSPLTTEAANSGRDLLYYVSYLLNVVINFIKFPKTILQLQWHNRNGCSSV